MKAIYFAVGLKRKLTNNLAPISKGEINLLIDMLEKEQAEKPTVVIFVEGGLITQINSTHELTVVNVDFDVEGVEPGQIKETPYGEEAMIKFGTVDTSAETPKEIAKWVALANQE